MNSRYTSLLLILFLFTGCSMPVEYYFRNFGKSEVKVELFLKDKTNKIPSIYYHQGIIDINKNSLNHMKNKLTFKQPSDSTLYITIPSKAVVSLGIGVNSINFQYKKMVLFNGLNNDTIFFSEKFLNVKKIKISTYGLYYCRLPFFSTLQK